MSSTKIEELEEVLRIIQESEKETALELEEKLRSLEERQSEAIVKFYEDLQRLENEEIASKTAIEKIRREFASRFDLLLVEKGSDQGAEIKEIATELPPGKISAIPVRKWDGEEKIVFLHIGKAGGTSFDGMMGKALKGRSKYVGGLHFDWTYVEERYPSGEVVTMLREPVSRAISHFHFMKKLSWTKGMAIRQQSIDQFLDDPVSMMHNRGCWQDGQAAVSWFTGTHVGNWVKKGRSAETNGEILERKAFNYQQELLETADKIDGMFWFGILEDLDRSLELLAFQLKLPFGSLSLPKSNSNKAPAAKPSEESMEKLQSLMPQDLWVYKYAKRVFQARWEYYKTGSFKPPNRPPFPKVNCLSTRFILKCTGGPYQGPRQSWTQ
ncbi:Oidioi.mRNA.OKI2018_I69.XSR.g16697.t1.cds [Oikopleura dioica]|uniref:Oidioi.mRNA.OKI2018_I69.XSR.g16697.t1.cds n=1 Tax=Oikopleura dioica TaxID=34765 RepID=A0ABN7SGY6_OIKDI|nr:Oidioi.mRNA.OKI2018_I69.XSR.g16697.t1.cds [Oikopleura dioica]